jgi:tetratricopeptide (TPR) repeat protein
MGAPATADANEATHSDGRRQAGEFQGDFPMQKVLRRSSGLALMLAMLLVPATWAQSAALQDAVKLYDQQEYVAAQQLLLKVDAGALNAEQRAELDRLLAQVADAVQGAERATQDRAAAEAAFLDGRWDDATRLYKQVEDNKYARPAVRDEARVRQAQVAEKKRLADAARPSGPIDNASTNQPESVVVVDVTPGTPAPAPRTVTVTAESPAVGSVTVVEDVETTEAEAVEAEAPEAAVAAEAAAPPAPRRRTIVDELRERDELLWQRATARAGELAAEARAAVAAQEFDIARARATAAIETIEAARVYAEPASRYEAARGAAVELQREVGAAYEAYQFEQVRQQQQQIVQRLGESARRMEQQKREQIEQLFNEANVLRKQREPAKAAEALRQILEIDPGNEKAMYLLDWALDDASWSQQGTSVDQIRERTREVLADVDTLLMPNDHLVTYPENWRELSERRGNLRTERRVDEHEDRKATERRLRRPVGAVEIEELLFEEAVALLRERFDADIRMDVVQLEDVGANLQVTVNFNAASTDVLTVLESIVRQVSSLDAPLAIDVLTDHVRIVPREELSVYGRQYDVFHAIPRDRNTSDRFGQTGTGAGGGLSTGTTTTTEDLTWEDYRDRIEESVIPSIRGGMDQEYWADPTRTDIQPFPNRYVMVRQTYEAQKLVESIVKGLGYGGAGPMQASFEARFLTITSNFLEEIGVDLDFVFNSGRAGYDQAFGADGTALRDPFSQSLILMPRNYGNAGFMPAPPALGLPLTPGDVPAQPYGNAALVPQGGGILPSGSRFTPLPIQNSSLDLANPAGLATGVPGSLNDLTTPALSIAGSFLDNLQVDFLIRATQATKRSSVMQAPRVLVTDGESAEIRIVRTFSIVSGLTGQVGETTGLAAPTGGDQLEEGVSLRLDNVTVTPNRQYVTSDVTIQNNGTPLITPFTIQRPSGNSPGLTVQQYEQDQNSIITTASIPDGGTVMLGGIKRVGEAEIDVGVPILSQIPILKRAFTNTSMVKDTQTVFILLKATIIIPEEAEVEAFPALGRVNE